ncbi:IclR family transcriptional regulator domain-containing protein [Streptomyces sp. NPDC054904]
MSERTDTDNLDDLLRTGPGRPARRTRGDREAARARLLGREDMWNEEVDAPALEPSWPDPGSSDPVRPDHAEAALQALSVAAVQALKSPSRLAVFASDLTLATGALVFACVLHLAGDEHGARFWWRYAAGADNRTAAYCLYLDHTRHGDYQDAQHWAHLATGDHPPFTPEPWWGCPLAEPLHREAYARIADFAALGRHLDLDDFPLPTPRVAKAVMAITPLPAPWDPPPTPGAWMLRRGARGKARTTLSSLRPHPPRPTRGPAPTARTTPATTTPAISQALKEARRALAVVRTLQEHRLGADVRQISVETGLNETTLKPLLDMLCEEEFADPITDTVYAPGLALDRLTLPGHAGIAAQLQRTLAITRQEIGAAIYLGRYTQGDIHITQAAAADNTPPVREYIPFRYAAHATAVGKALLGQLDPEGQADHVSRYKTEAFTERTISNPHTLLERLSGLRPGAPVYDAFEYGPDWCCSAVPIGTGGEAGALALSLPATHIHRLKDATQQLRRKAVPIMLVLLLTGEIPAEGPVEETETSPLARTTDDGLITPGTLIRLRRMFTKPLISAAAIRTTALGRPGPHLVTDENSPNVYYFDAGPAPTWTGSPLTLPQTLTVPPASGPQAPITDVGWRRPDPHTMGDLTVYRT